MTCLKENQVHYRIYKTHQMDQILTQINSHNTLKTHAFQLNILLSCHRYLVLPHIYEVLHKVSHLFFGHYCYKEVQMNLRKTKRKIHRRSKSCGIHIYWDIATDLSKTYDAFIFGNTATRSSNIAG
jgi:hypothetical protein